MSKNLKAIQTISKVCKVISMIIFVLSIIGAIATALSSALVLAIKDISLDGTSITAMLLEEGVSLSDGIFSMIFAMFACIGSAIVAKFAHIYFTNELEAGTPFTYEGAKELLRLGILSIAIPAGISLITSFAFIFYKQFNAPLTDIEFNFSIDIGIGIALIIMSVIFKYGAEREELHQSKEYE